MDSNTASALIGLAGALIGAGVAAGFARRAELKNLAKDRRDNAFALHREFHSLDMLSARSNAWHFLRGRPEMSFRDLDTDQDTAEQAAPFWHVVGFYHRVAVSARNDYIERELLLELFGNIFIWWYLLHIKGKIPEEAWDAAEKITWLYAQMTDEVRLGYGRLDDWKMWHRRAFQDSQDYDVALSTAAKETFEKVEAMAYYSGYWERPYRAMP